MKWFTIDEIEAEHKKLSQRIIDGYEVGIRDWSDLFDRHSNLIMAYRQLEHAFLALHGCSSDTYTLERNDKVMQIRARQKNAAGDPFR